MYAHGMIAPVLALVLWSLVIWLWMYATRIPAMQKAKIAPQTVAAAGSLKDRLPLKVGQIADNYNHLMEQPTIFYAAAIAAHLAGATDPVNIGLAWAYVALRAVHSLVQCTVNIVVVRFSIFVLSTLALGALAIRTVFAL
ncbi:MAPEG family protein [Amphiplicatus metriothermophilus]|uniref:MAPEG family protein n=1 Tax=Amphiplicatus metriothermophilus TaxID=1519374 RepID=A0A239PZT4_9PROT|nr:MAPEG family protein [Amphiplicatus metriothermophilus]MBB5518236.1 hypothetical protein [Amphiplicatus metriothermophilus]SNT75442.1 hypothetical protein SAMN06297382_2741 [Amphiplicatus metriothermophilus]